jgi:hypothetical protein
MGKSKGIIVIAVGLIAVLIVWKIGFSSSQTPANKTKNETTGNSQRTTNSPNQPAAPTGRIAGNARASRDNTAGAGARNDTAQAADRNAGRTPPAYAMESTGLKISIPSDANEAVLQVLYNEYLKINPMGNFMGRNRGNRGGNQNGMDRGASQGRMGRGGGMMGGMGGGMDMGAFQGMDFGGMMNMGGMDMGAMQDAMMNMGGGFPGGGMDMGAPMGGPDMGAPMGGPDMGAPMGGPDMGAP